MLPPNHRRLPSALGRPPLRTLLILCLVCCVLSGGFRQASAQSIFQEFGIKEEQELGRKFEALIKSRMPVVEDPEIKGYVQDLVAQLTRAMPPQPFTIKVDVLRHPALNAFAVPGGSVFVHTGLIMDFERESQLAGVLAHELAHVSQRHIAGRIERMQAMSLATIAGALASVFVGSSDARRALIMGSGAATQAASLNYSRIDEREADQVGLGYLIDAGFRPQGLMEGLEIIRQKKWQSTGDAPSYLSTHPGAAERVGYLSDRIARLSPGLLERPEKSRTYDRVKTLVRARYADVTPGLAYYENLEAETGRPPSCLDTLGHAILLDRANRVGEASALFREALSCAGSDPLYFREAGRHEFEFGSLIEAESHLTRAVMTAPRDVIALFYYARLQGEKGRPAEAVDSFERVLARLPHDAEVHYYFGRLLGQAGQISKAHVHLAYSALYSGKYEEARFHLGKAKAAAANEADSELIKRFEGARDELEALRDS